MKCASRAEHAPRGRARLKRAPPQHEHIFTSCFLPSHLLEQTINIPPHESRNQRPHMTQHSSRPTLPAPSLTSANRPASPSSIHCTPKRNQKETTKTETITRPQRDLEYTITRPQRDHNVANKHVDTQMHMFEAHFS